MRHPMSLPLMSSKTSETAQNKQDGEDTQTFENDSNFWAPNVAKRPRDPVGHNIYRFRFVGENVEFVSMPKIFSRVNFDSIPICLR